MTGSDTSDKNFDRHIYGPRAISAVLPNIVRPAYRRRSAVGGQLLADWELIVGPAIAAVTMPRKIFAGTLTIVCSSPMALELQHLSDVVIGRINTHFGQTLVTRLRFVRDIAPPAPPPSPPRRHAIAAAERAVAGLPEGELRDALERLGRVVLAPR